jgi:hypothetical protein
VITALAISQRFHQHKDEMKIKNYLELDNAIDVAATTKKTVANSGKQFGDIS